MTIVGERHEFLTRGDCPPAAELAPGVALRVFASGALGAQRLTTCSATLAPGAVLPHHTHPCSEVIVPVRGSADLWVEGRRYRLEPFDAVHVPAGVPHRVSNEGGEPAVLFTAFASGEPERVWVDPTWDEEPKSAPGPTDPETLIRFAEAPVYELAPEAFFRDLFNSRLGCRGICGGYGRFQPGASLPCHFHGYDESITIVEGSAVCQAAGTEYSLAGLDTACIPEGRPHRFINQTEQPMAMLWVYAGDEPERTIVETCNCEGRAHPKAGER